MARGLDQMARGRCSLCGGRLEFHRRNEEMGTVEFTCDGGCGFITEVQEPR